MPMTKAKRDALYARLIVEEYRRRASVGFADGIFYVGFGDHHGYASFIRAQADTRHGNVYAMALKQICGR